MKKNEVKFHTDDTKTNEDFNNINYENFIAKSDEEKYDLLSNCKKTNALYIDNIKQLQIGSEENLIKNNDLENENENLKNTIKKHKTDNLNVLKKIQEMTEQINVLKENSKKFEVENNIKMDNIINENKSLLDKINNLTNDVNDLKDENKDLTKKVNNLKEENENLSNNVNNLKEENENLTNDVNDLKDENKDLTKKVNNLKEENENLSNNVNNLKEENENLSNNVNNLKEENENLSNNVNNLKEENENLSNNVINNKKYYNEQINICNNLIKKNQTEIYNLKIEINENKDEFKELKKLKDIFFKYISLIYFRKIFNLCLEFILKNNENDFKLVSGKILYTNTKERKKEVILNSIISFLFKFKKYFSNIIHVHNNFLNKKKPDFDENDEIYKEIKESFSKNKFLISKYDNELIFEKFFGFKYRKLNYKEIFEMIFGRSKYFNDIINVLNLEKNIDEFYFNDEDFDLNYYLNEKFGI
jgi:predicted RNase H-like nuclease (RuvC/YqgF family)